MNFQPPNGHVDEPALLQLYRELTGATETQARSVFMYVCSKEKHSEPAANGLALKMDLRPGSSSQAAPESDSSSIGEPPFGRFVIKPSLSTS
jgi:hypothetical protein